MFTINLFEFITWQFILNALAILGFYTLILYLIDNLKSVILMVKSVLSPYFQPQANQSLDEKYGSWALITGATDGIGKQYAKELASRGLNIILVSRTQQKLQQVSQEIESVYRVKTKWIVADFSKGKEVYDHIERELEGIPVGILVNNVGRMYDYPEELVKISDELIWDLININVGACTIMTRMIASKMKKIGKGAIVNISSGSELQPLPLMAVYSATKIYVKSLTLALQHELAQYGITVQLVTPMYVVTKMNEYASSVMKGGLLVPDVRSYTKSAVFTLGKTNETTGYWTHGVQYACMKIAPAWLRTRIGLNMNTKFRRDYFIKHPERIENIKQN